MPQARGHDGRTPEELVKRPRQGKLVEKNPRVSLGKVQGGPGALLYPSEDAWIAKTVGFRRTARRLRDDAARPNLAQVPTAKTGAAASAFKRSPNLPHCRRRAVSLVFTVLLPPGFNCRGALSPTPSGKCHPGLSNERRTAAGSDGKGSTTAALAGMSTVSATKGEYTDKARASKVFNPLEGVQPPSTSSSRSSNRFRILLHARCTRG